MVSLTARQRRVKYACYTVNLSLSIVSALPPLLFVTFVENAFKHGISYQQPSFVDVRVALSNDTLVFHCQNSRHPAPASQQDQQQGGVGLHNIRERLKLIYGDRYSLRINEGSDTYNVDLILPL